MTTAFVWTLLAGAATAVGGLIAVHRRVRSDTGLALALGFAAGAMVLVSVAAFFVGAAMAARWLPAATGMAAAGFAAGSGAPVSGGHCARPK